MVEGLQIHRHSPTCCQKGSCRFNYPKPPSPYTIISDELQENCQQQIDFAVKNLTAVKQVLEQKDLYTDITLQEVLDRAHVTLDDYTKSLSISKCGQSVILKRKPSEQSVNYYFSSRSQSMGSKYGYPVCRQCICLCHVYCIIRVESRKRNG